MSADKLGVEDIFIQNVNDEYCVLIDGKFDVWYKYTFATKKIEYYDEED